MAAFGCSLVVCDKMGKCGKDGENGERELCPWRREEEIIERTKEVKRRRASNRQTKFHYHQSIAHIL
jgi:hypothetical protein